MNVRQVNQVKPAIDQYAFVFRVQKMQVNGMQIRTIISGAIKEIPLRSRQA